MEPRPESLSLRSPNNHINELKSRAGLPPAVTNKMWEAWAREEDIVWQILDQLQKIAVRKTVDHLDKGTPFWIDREDWLEELKVNILDDMLCKALVGHFTKGLYKDWLFKEAKAKMVKQIMTKFGDPPKGTAKNAIATFYAKFASDVGADWLHKKLPVLSDISSTFCPGVCDDSSEARLSDADNCGKCGSKVSTTSP